MVGSWVLILSLFSLMIAFSFTTDALTGAEGGVILARTLEQDSITVAEESACRESGGTNCACQGRISGHVRYEGALPRPYLTMSAAERQTLARAQSTQRCGDETGQFF
ncbi:hypothetical protein R3X27_13425 [Tropicimonas sp. TH_r6]|uniref:hypothetical protein n=1 Tax=Tropicimonas sp. TH_r6 TaxID=3082085 RepID=UPI002952CCE8|nr:hypothetical protein [Tropicimonas sp. TH_r6]MDV7143681.1 hypothetical protein [Tropicimonas sp. TH_r6]